MRTVAPGDDGMRLDRWFKRHFPDIPVPMLQKLCRKGQIRVDGGRIKPDTRLAAGQEIRIPPVERAAPRGEARPPLSDADRHLVRDAILFEDDTLLVLNKPAGLAVQGGSGTRRHLDAMVAAYAQTDPPPRLAHRLDRDTSGVLIFAKTADAAAKIGKAFQGHKVEKTYWALVHGRPKPLHGEIKGFLRKAPGGKKGREQMMPARHGEEGAQYARTLYTTHASAGARASLVALRPLTGRTHQLRVHMGLLGHSMIGERKYTCDHPTPGGLSEGLHLHAARLRLDHPRTGRRVTFCAPFPQQFAHSCAVLGLDLPSVADEPDESTWT